MGFPRIIFSLTALLLIFFSNISFSQIVFKEIPGYQQNFSDSSFFGLSKTRSIISLNGEWVVYSAEDEEQKKISVNIPSIFKGNAQLIFERSFKLSRDQVLGKRAKIYFMGLNYLADIIVNDIVVYRHRGGEYPFTVELPREILQADKNNFISIKLSYELDPENTIPLKPRFLFPANYGGLIRDVYLYLEPNVSIADFNIFFVKDIKTNKLLLNIRERIENKEFKIKPDTLDLKNEYRISINLYNPDHSLSARAVEPGFQLKLNETRQFQHTIEVANPFYWTPETPLLYSIGISLTLDGELVDTLSREIPVYTLTSSVDELQLNGQPFSMKGVTYIPSFGESGNLASFNRMEEDIQMIKKTGFNSVRFAKSVPHPYYLNLCEKYGLLSFIEIPLNYVPSGFSTDPDFVTRVKNYLTEFVEGYSLFGRFTAVGLGSSYLAILPEHQSFIKELQNSLPEDNHYFTYASFTGTEIEIIENLDLYGIEITGNSFLDDTSGISSVTNELGEGKVFISSVTYFVNAGGSSGYSNENTYEAQAKYFEDFITAFSGNASGYFINTMFNYRGDFSSVISGYDENNIYNIGLMSEDRNTAFLSQKVVQSKLHNADRVTIPIGTKNDGSPMSFIIVGLALALIVGVLVNSGRKFREDASRALLRPYNFFADVRDQRIMSSYHSSVLALVLAVVMALICSSFFYYVKDNIIFEKLLLAVGSKDLINIVSYLAWNPLNAIIWLSVFFIAAIILLVVIIKFGSLFVRNRVYISSIYFSVVWALIPFVLLIPVGIILYRALDAEVANAYVYLGLILFALWVFYRLMKGIYVIFDINPGPVYFYSIVIVLVLICVFVLYYEIQNSFIDYLLLTLKQYKLIDLM